MSRLSFPDAVREQHGSKAPMLAIGGGAVAVTSMVPPDGDAHALQLRPADVRRLREAGMVVENGLGLEGLALFALLMALVWNPAIRARRGFVSGAFLAGYGAARLVGELFRQPDAHLGFLFAGATMGQLLSVPMVLVGAWLMLRARPAPVPAAEAAR